MNKVEKIVNALEQMFPNAHVELNHKNSFELLVAVVLSAQTTDVSVNKVTPKLFRLYPTPDQLAKARLVDIEACIKQIGLYRNKAKHIKALSQLLVYEHQGVVPNNRKALEELPGVGRKTANVVLSNAFGIPAFAVDTHVARVSIRLGLADANDHVVEIEKRLMQHFDESLWQKLHHQMIFFGRYHCTAKKPKCIKCPLFDICKYPLKNDTQ
jgi:endonuclease III